MPHQKQSTKHRLLRSVPLLCSSCRWPSLLYSYSQWPSDMWNIWVSMQFVPNFFEWMKIASLESCLFKRKLLFLSMISRVLFSSLRSIHGSSSPPLSMFSGSSGDMYTRPKIEVPVSAYVPITTCTLVYRLVNVYNITLWHDHQLALRAARLSSPIYWIDALAALLELISELS